MPDPPGQVANGLPRLQRRAVPLLGLSDPARFAVKEYRIISQGLALRVIESGRGRPLLCLHGLGCDHHMFDDLSRELSPSFRVVRMALRGHGRSDDPRRHWSVKDVAGDILAVMDRLDLRQTVLVGHSLGGMAALQAALLAPHRISAMVLIATSAEEEAPKRKAQLESLALAIRLTGLRKGMLRIAAEGFFSPQFRAKHPEKVAEWCRRWRAMPKHALLHALHAVGERPSVMRRLGEIAIPVLVACGEQDTIADPAHAAAMVAALPDATLAVVPDTGHALPIECPRQLAVLMRDFMTAHGFPKAPPGDNHHSN